MSPKPINLLPKFLVTLALILTVALTAAADRPNVLFIATDDMNCDLGSYGHPLVKSPNIDRLAARGVRFEHTYSQNPVCNPSRTSFMTGLYPEQTNINTNAGHFREFIPEVVTMAQHFRNNGYYVARIGKIYHYGVPDNIGENGNDDAPSWEEVRNPIGVDKVVEPNLNIIVPGESPGGTLSWLKVPSKDEEHTDGIGASYAIEMLDKNHPDKTGRPFFLAMGFYRPHTPYVAPEHYFDWYPKESIDPVMLHPNDRDDIPKAALPDRPNQLDLTVDERKEIIQAYYASISLVDAQVGRLLDALDDLKLADNTVVVFVSDHGYHLGAHGLWQKSDLFEGSARVPLIIASPFEDAARGETTKSLTELVDLYPTLSELCGIKAPSHVAGRSVVPVLQNPGQSIRDEAYSVTDCRTVRRWDNSKFLGRSIRTDRYRYTEWDEGSFGVELYDYERDPEEFTNLAYNPEHADLMASLRRRLHERQSEANVDRL